MWQQAKAEYFFADRHYGKKLTDGTMAAALATFANNGEPKEPSGGSVGTSHKTALKCRAGG